MSRRSDAMLGERQRLEQFGMVWQIPRMSGDTGGVFDGGCGLGLAAEDEATAFAAFV